MKDNSNCDLRICESIARNYIPRVRAELVRYLISRYGFSQSKVAAAMGISRAAVSQYVNGKRGYNDVPLSQDMRGVVYNWAEQIAHGTNRTSICEICDCLSHVNGE